MTLHRLWIVVVLKCFGHWRRSGLLKSVRRLKSGDEMSIVNRMGSELLFNSLAAIAADSETSQPSEPNTLSFCARPDGNSCIRWLFPCFDTPGSSG